MPNQVLRPDFAKRGGLLIAIIQNAKTKEVLMQGFMNEESWQQTLQTGKVCFYSTSRQKLWLKGETPGNYLIVKSIALDCDLDAVLIKVEVSGNGPVCHYGRVSCFFNDVCLCENLVD